MVVSAALLLALALTGCEQVTTPVPATATPASQRTSTPLPVQPAATTSPPQPVLATPTPTASPTAAPVVHVIQAGDTLGGIAAAYGVSVQALQEANGIENPLLLQIGQELVIPLGQETGAPEPGMILPTPTPLIFGIRGVSFYETPVGSLWCLGEVVNTTLYTLTNVVVHVTLYDPSGTPVIEGDATAATDILPPAERAPFGILFIAPPDNFASHQVAVLRGEFVAEFTAGYVPLTVEEGQGAPIGPQFQVVGTLHNGDPTRAVTDVLVVATTYDGEGRVTGFRQQQIDVGEGLEPGGSVPFQMLLTAHGGVPADFSVIAFGHEAP